MLSRTAPRSIPQCCRAASSSSRQHFLAQRAKPSRVATKAAPSRQTQQNFYRPFFAVAFAGGLATLSQSYLNGGQFVRSSEAEAPPQPEENPLVFEESRKKAGVTKEENRDLISSQHHQVKQSWENPGLHAWGSNTGRVVAPDRPEEANIKTPRRISWFDGKLLRDVKLDRYFGVAIDERGDLVQWGTGYRPDIEQPEVTLKGKNLVSLTLSRDRILGLSSGGKVYSVPVSAKEQSGDSKPSESSWIPFWSGRSPISYRTLAPNDLAYSEKVTSVAGGLEHAVLLTSKGRIFSLAASADSFPSRGQLGVPGLTWLTRPEGAYDTPHEITTLRGFPIIQVACGDHHTLALDQDGRVFTWGDNASGQLGFDPSPEATIVDAPSLLPTQKLYAGTSQVPRITSIAAGGANSYLTVEATKVHAPNTSPDDRKALLGLGRITADTFAFGQGITGSLANNRWTHVQATPTRIPALSGLFEYDEAANTAVPIRLAAISAGATHAAAVMRNVTHTSASAASSADDTNWGADVVFWGGNEHFQLGTGKRNNVSSPVYIQPLDLEAEVKRAKRSSGGREEHRFHVTPRAKALVGGEGGRWKEVEQRVVCGRGVTGVFSSV